MLLDVLKGTWAEDKDFYYLCTECERYVRTDPNTSAAKAKTALESFVTDILISKGIEIPEYKGNDKKYTCNERIKRSYKEGFITEAQNNMMHSVRKAGNGATHVGKNGVRSNKTTVHEAAEIFQNLYAAVCSYVLRKKDTGIFLYDEIEEKLPIGGFDVIEPAYASSSDDVIPSYKCVKRGNRPEYSIIRKFRKNDTEDVRQIRDILAMQELRINFAYVEHKPIEAEEIPVSDECEYRYIKYTTAKDTVLLSQKNKIRKLNLSTCDRVKIFGDIVDILSALTDIGSGVSLHHRALNPNCVFITPTRKGYHVQIGNFECSKIMRDGNAEQSEYTVFKPGYIGKMKNNMYMPPEIRTDAINNITSIDWEQIDVYSCAMVFLFIMSGKTPAEGELFAIIEILKRFCSADILDMTRKILEAPYGSRPSLEAYLQTINKEVALHEQQSDNV